MPWNEKAGRLFDRMLRLLSGECIVRLTKMGSNDPNKDAHPRLRCASGHKFDPKQPERCKYCDKVLEYADGLHVHDPRS